MHTLKAVRNVLISIVLASLLSGCPSTAQGVAAGVGLLLGSSNRAARAGQPVAGSYSDRRPTICSNLTGGCYSSYTARGQAETRHRAAVPREH